MSLSSSRGRFIRRSLKAFAHGVALAIASPAAALCLLERRLSPHAEDVFGFWAHVFALMPGLPGVYLRRGFFQLTLDRCAGQCFIGFGSIFTHRHATVEEGVYIGHYSMIGCAVLRAGALIGSQVSLLSGPTLHEWDAERGWLPANLESLQQIEIGTGAWIGERAVVMADVGAGAMVAAGSVVSAPVPPRVMVAGNPARFVRRIEPEPASVPSADPAPALAR